MSHDSFSEFVLDQLHKLGTVVCQPMFGGNGLYREEQMFGIVFDGSLYFRTDEQTRARYTASGMKPFAPNPRQTLKSYYQVPVDVVEDADQLVEWGAEAVRCAAAELESKGAE